MLLALAGHDVVGLRRVLDPVSVGDQPLHPDIAPGDQLQEGGHVPALGPADVGQGVVDAVSLVGRVVTARAVGTADDQPDFLLEERAAFEIETDVPDDDDAALEAADLNRLAHYLAGARRCTEQHRVGAVSAGERGHRSREIRIRQVRALSPQGARQLHPERIQVAGQHAGARGARQLGGDLPHQPQPQHDDLLAELELGQPDALHGDGPQSHETRGVV